MIKKNSFIGLVVGITLALSEPSFAWRGKTSLADTVLGIAGLGAMIVVDISSSVLNSTTGFISRKIAGVTRYFRSDRPDEEIAQDEAAHQALKHQAQLLLSSFEEQLRNYCSLKKIALNQENGLANIFAFVIEMKGRINSPEFKSETILCAFKQKFFPILNEPLTLNQMKIWLDAYQQNSIIPDDFVAKSAQHFSLNQQEAKAVFGMIIHAFKYASISLTEDRQ